MREDKKNSKDRIEEELVNTDSEAAEANLEIQDEFYSDEETAGPSSSPVPYVSNNTAPLSSVNEKKKKK